jgi:plasmid stabilization system protein ParE
VAALIYSRRALADLERLFEFLAEKDPGAAGKAIRAVREAVSILERHALIGRPVEHGLRELVISHGRTGYIGLYRHVLPDDVVLILALRHQREAGYRFE